ncbi:MAG: hypothetical protein QM751_06250 [Paludibacteraceae bacterium]
MELTLNSSTPILSKGDLIEQAAKLLYVSPERVKCELKTSGRGFSERSDKCYFLVSVSSRLTSDDSSHNGLFLGFVRSSEVLTGGCVRLTNFVGVFPLFFCRLYFSNVSFAVTYYEFTVI